MDSDEAHYTNKYQEQELLGRGNYGSAYVVKNKQNGKLFVAKKMNLDGMLEHEVDAAKEEVEILKKFSDVNLYPFIVKYIQCFCFDKTLIIVMEYCEYGDLSTFIKHAKKKGELLDQKTILAWFAMLAIGIKALHSKNVLHRDLKSANVFLTSNKFVKIGDFGISKVLDTTSAKTFVGTPYYLSPEVCMSKKYDLRSDLWSLGCILYELCTLNYPFQATNILTLARKITSDEVEPISSKYSKGLNDIVMGLLTKDQNKRMTIQQILNMPYMQKFLNEYGQKMEQICSEIPIKKTLKSAIKTIDPPKESEQSSNSTAEDTMKTIRSNFQQTKGNTTVNRSFKEESLNYSNTEMSPTLMMKMRQMQKNKQREAELNKACRDQINQIGNFAKSKKQEQFGGSGSNFGHKNQARDLHKKYQDQNKQIAEAHYKKKNGLNDNQSIDLEQLQCELTRQFNGLNLTKGQNNSQTLNSPSKLKNTVERQFHGKINVVEEDIQVDSDQDEELEEYYDDDFEDYIPDEEDKVKSEKQNNVFKSIISVVAGKKDDISPSKLMVVQKTFQKTPISSGSKSNTDRKNQCIKKCISIIKEQRYKLLYELVSNCYKNNKYTQTKQLKELRSQGSPTQKQALKLIEEIKYYQSME